MYMKFKRFWKKGWVSLPNYFRTLLFRKEVATETSRRSSFRTPFGNQRVNAFQTPLKIARHHYYPFFPWISGKLSCEKTALLWSKILRLFANTLTADDMYSCRNMQNCLQKLQTLLYQKCKTWLPMTCIPAAICRIVCKNFKRFYIKNARHFLDILFHFWNVHKI